MQHFLFSAHKLHKMVSVVGLMALLMPFGSMVHAQDQKSAKPAEQNEELNSVKERLRQLEERFINMQSRLGTIESMSGQRSTPMTGQGAASQRNNSTPNSGSYGNQSAGRSSGIQTDESQGQGFRPSQSPGQELPMMRSGATDDSQIPAPVPTKKRRRIDEDGAFSPFDQSSVQPSKPAQEGGQNRVASAAAMPIQGNGRLDVRQKIKVLHAPLGFDNSSPKSLYQDSYRMLLKPNYTAAEKGFSYFLQQYPKDKRASNAQYWLGEAYFVQKKYKNAATAYLRGYKKYPNSNKAPDSFLKLAVSLKKLGQKQASCATFKAFPSKYPNATSYVNRRYKIMLAQAGC